MADTSLEMRLALDAARWHRNWRDVERRTQKGARSMGRHVSQVGQVLRGVRGQLVGLGVGWGATQLVQQSAQLDKSLIGVKQTAGATTAQAKQLREELFRMSGETGQALEGLQGGFNNLVQAGLEWDAAMATIPEINKAMAVTSAQAEVLSGALAVAGEAFQFDLSQPGLALDLLDQMVVAGRLGNAELEDLSSIFGRIGVNAKSANLGFGQTLGFVEQLSLIERKPERLATLADSTLRIFTNQNYKRAASQATGIPFFDGDGSARSPLDVLDDIARKYKKLTTDAQRESFIAAAFGATDLDTQRGLRSLLSGDAMGNMRGMVAQIQTASGAINRDLSEALDNSVDQAGRLRTVLRRAADEFASPINKVIADVIQKGLNSKEAGGLGLTGGQLIGGGAAVLGGLALGKKFGGKLLSRLSGGALGTAQGVAVGKSLEAAAGVTPVYVVNMPGDLGGGFSKSTIGRVVGGLAGGSTGRVIKGLGLRHLLGQNVGTLTRMGGMFTGTVGAGVTAAGLGGYGVGTVLNKTLLEGTAAGDAIGRALARALAVAGVGSARDALANEKYLLSIELESKDVNAKVKRMPDTHNSPFGLDVYSGPAMNWVP